MRIAVFVNKFPSLSETFVLSHIEGLMRRGHEVEVFACERDETAVDQDNSRGENWPVRVSYRPTTPPKLGSRAILAIKAWRKATWPGRRVLLRSRKGWRVGKRQASLLLILDAAQIDGPRRYDIIHCHFAPHAVRAELLGLTGAIRGPLVASVHGYDVSAAVSRRVESWRNRTLRCAELILPVNAYFQTRLQAWGCDPDRMVVHHMGVDLEHLVYRAPQSIPGKPLHLVSVARLVEKKGLEYALRAVSQAGVCPGQVQGVGGLIP